ncbi:MAG: PQQ-like beta-propeller repeat protein, partial [Calditrichaeota bacterium]|nr:PQQ-like beta-propeller repeat protein [Calditrichota bacterium]
MSKTSIILAISILGLSDSLVAQPEIDQLRYYDRGGTDIFQDIYACANGDFYLCGGTDGRPWLVCLDAEGALRWERVLNGARLWSVIEADNGDAVASGTAGGRGFGAVRFNRDGDRVWEQGYEDGRASAIIELKDGRFAIGGIYFGEDNSRAGLVAVIDAEGEVDWISRYDEGRGFHGLRETQDGLVLAGQAWADSGRSTTTWFVKVNYEGVVIWSTLHLPEGATDAYATSLISTPGGFAAGGICYRANGEGGFAVFRFDADGNPIANHIIDNRSYLESINKLSDEGFILVGTRNIGDIDYPMAIRLDREGNIRWSKDFANVVDGQPRNQRRYNQLMSVIVLPHNTIVACGIMNNDRENRGHDGVVVRLEPDIFGPRFIRYEPEDTLLGVLAMSEVDFIAVARSTYGGVIDYRWTLDDQELEAQGDTLIHIDFEVPGEQVVQCEVSVDNITAAILWHVTVVELLITSHTPDTLSLTIQRNSEIDFSLDSVAYIGDRENLRYEWMIYDSTAVRWEEVAGDDRIGIRSYAFNRTGGYALKAKVFDPNVDPIPADSIQWNIQVRGVIRAFEPNLPELFLEPRQEAT